MCKSAFTLAPSVSISLPHTFLFNQYSNGVSLLTISFALIYNLMHHRSIVISYGYYSVEDGDTMTDKDNLSSLSTSDRFLLLQLTEIAKELAAIDARKNELLAKRESLIESTLASMPHSLLTRRYAKQLRCLTKSDAIEKSDRVAKRHFSGNGKRTALVCLTGGIIVVWLWLFFFVDPIREAIMGALLG